MREGGPGERGKAKASVLGVNVQTVRIWRDLEGLGGATEEETGVEDGTEGER